MKGTTNWKNLLQLAFEDTGDDFSKMITTLTEEQLAQEFVNSYFGPTEGAPFTAWGEAYVYFPTKVFGNDSIGYALRNPCDIKTPTNQ